MVAQKKKVSIEFPVLLLAALDARAKKLGLSRSDVVRQILREALDVETR